MKIKRLDLKILIEDLIKEEYPYVSNQKKSDEFRSWMLDNEPAASKEKDIDITKKSGAASWAGLEIAYDKFGREFEESQEEDFETYDTKNKIDLENARKEGNIITTTVGSAIKKLTQISRSGTLDLIPTSFLQKVTGIPLHYLILMSFIMLRSKELKIAASNAKEGMQKVAEKVHKRLGRPNKKFLITYKDYKKVSDGMPTYGFGFQIHKPNSDNIIGQLSSFFGNCTAYPQSDGTFTIVDQYDFNVFRQPGHQKSDFEEAIPTIANTYKSFKMFLDYVFSGFDGNAAAALEPLLLQYETQLNYKGVPTSIRTKKSKTSFA